MYSISHMRSSNQTPLGITTTDEGRDYLLVLLPTPPSCCRRCHPRRLSKLFTHPSHPRIVVSHLFWPHPTSTSNTTRTINIRTYIHTFIPARVNPTLSTGALHHYTRTVISASLFQPPTKRALCITQPGWLAVPRDRLTRAQGRQYRSCQSLPDRSASLLFHSSATQSPVPTLTLLAFYHYLRPLPSLCA